MVIESGGVGGTDSKGEERFQVNEYYFLDCNGLKLYRCMLIKAH